MRVVHLAVVGNCNFGSHIVGAMSRFGGKGVSFKDLVGGYFKKNVSCSGRVWLRLSQMIPNVEHLSWFLLVIPR